MSGYTPVFDTVFQGTLCGKWPTLPVWLTILPMADKNGLIDMTFHHIAAISGWPVDLLKQAIAELTAPDPESRSAEAEGRRLIPIDENRPWGWRVVNHEKYREKARLSAKSAKEVAEGKNKDRMHDRRSPPKTAADPLSNSNSNSNIQNQRAIKIASSEKPQESSSQRHQSSEALRRIRDRISNGL
jgi:hypothetical protein